MNLHVGSHKNSHPNYDNHRWFTPWFKLVKKVAEFEGVTIGPEEEKEYLQLFYDGLTPTKAFYRTKFKREENG